jgi:hypothetical protein
MAEKLDEKFIGAAAQQATLVLGHQGIRGSEAENPNTREFKLM